MGKENPANRETDADAEEDAAEPDVMIHIHLQRMVDGDRAVARCGATLEAAKAHSRVAQRVGVHAHSGRCGSQRGETLHRLHAMPRIRQECSAEAQIRVARVRVTIPPTGSPTGLRIVCAPTLGARSPPKRMRGGRPERPPRRPPLGAVQGQRATFEKRRGLGHTTPLDPLRAPRSGLVARGDRSMDSVTLAKPAPAACTTKARSWDKTPA